MSDLIGRPWKPAAAHAPRPPRPEPRPRAAGVPRARVALAVVLVLLGGLAVGVYVYGQLEQKRRVVGEQRELFARYLAERARAFQELPLLDARQQQLLRRSLHTQHVEAAQRLGITPIGSRAQLEQRAQQLGLVRLAETEAFWVTRATYSVPYATPDAASAIDSIAARFHARLAAAGLPPMQFNITSVLRTAEDQARLRRVNVNAARGASSHEFATTFDVHYARFRYAADARAEVARALGPLPYAFLYDEFARELSEFYATMASRYGSRLGAELGRALIELENQGTLLALRERRQPIYHVTVSRRLAGAHSTM